MVVGGQNSGPHAGPARVLTQEPSPLSHCFLFITYFFLPYFQFVCCFLPAFMSVHHIRTVPVKGSKGGQITLETGVKIAVSCQVGAGN